MQNNQNFVTVSQLNFYLNGIIGAEEMLHGILLMGEVSGASMSGGNLYFTLKDETSQIPACCFSVERTYRPSNGEKILARGSVDYYQKGGKISFIATQIQPYGLGELQAELERRKEKLRAEGIFDEDHKKPMPKFVQKLGVVTSINGAVISDIVSTIRKTNKLMDILVFDTKVQGEGAAESMSEALLKADGEGLDAIILARGGGSFEDLMPFNDEKLARVIYGMKTFVISAVGHETDYSISDMVADRRALTPTAGAEMVTYDPEELVVAIQEKLLDAKDAIERKIMLMGNRVTGTVSSVKYAVERKLAMVEYGVQSTLARAENKVGNKIFARENDLAVLNSKISALNPAKLLEKGYFKVYKGSKSIQSVADVKKNDKIMMYSTDGKITAVVEDVEKRGEIK